MSEAPTGDARRALLRRLLNGTRHGLVHWTKAGECEYTSDLTDDVHVSIVSKDKDDVAPFLLAIQTTGGSQTHFESIFNPRDPQNVDSQAFNRSLAELYVAAKIASVAGDPGIRAAMAALEELGIDDEL